MGIKLGKVLGGVVKTVGLSVGTAVKTVGNVATGNFNQIGKDFKSLNEKNKEIFEGFSGKKVSDKDMQFVNSVADMAAQAITVDPKGISLGSLKDGVIHAAAGTYLGRPDGGGVAGPGVIQTSSGIPADFDPQGYYQNNPDVYAWANSDGTATDDEARSHYLAAGHRENRKYTVQKSNPTPINNMLPSKGIAAGNGIAYSNNLTASQKAQVEQALENKAGTNDQPQEPTMWDKIKKWYEENKTLGICLMIGFPVILIGVIWWWSTSKKGKKSYGRRY
jgi:hypothetical protein